MDVRMPDGTIITGVPDNITQTELLARYSKFSAAPPVQTPPPEPVTADVMGAPTGIAGVLNKPVEGFGASKPIEGFDESAPVKEGPVKLPFTAEQQKEASFLEEMGKGIKGAFEYALPSMVQQTKLQGSADAFITKQKSLELMNKIDSGEFKNLNELKSDPAYAALVESGQNVAQLNAYMANRSQPEVAAKLRGKVEQDLNKMGASADTSIDLLNKYARENQEKYGARVEKFTDINWTDPQVVADFTNWMGFNMGSAGVQLAPIVLAGVVFKQPGVFTLGSAMETAGAVQNRMEAIAKKTKDMSPAEQKQEIKKYLAETGDANLIIGAASGSFDMFLGPAATAAKTAAKDLLKAGAIKKAVKELPGDIAEEGLTGALQEATQIAGKKALGEAPKRITMEDVKDIINAATAEAAGAPAGTAINVGRAALFAPASEKEETKDEGITSLLDKLDKEVRQGPPPAAPATTPVAPVEPPPAPPAATQAAPEAPSTELVKEAIPQEDEASMDLEAMLKELEDLVENKPAAEAPAAEAPAEPKVEAPSTKLVEETKPAEPKAEVQGQEEPAATASNVIRATDLPDGMQTHVFKTNEGFGAGLYDTDSAQYVNGSIRRFTGDVAEAKAAGYAIDLAKKAQPKAEAPKTEEKFGEMSLEEFQSKHPKPYNVTADILKTDITKMSDQGVLDTFGRDDLVTLAKLLDTNTSGTKQTLLSNIRKVQANRERMKDMTPDQIESMSVGELNKLVADLGGNPSYKGKADLVKYVTDWRDSSLNRTKEMVAESNHVKHVVQSVKQGNQNVSDENIKRYAPELWEAVNPDTQKDLYQKLLRKQAVSLYAPPFMGVPQTIVGLRDEADRTDDDIKARKLTDLADSLQSMYDKGRKEEAPAVEETTAEEEKMDPDEIFFNLKDDEKKNRPIDQDLINGMDRATAEQVLRKYEKYRKDNFGSAHKPTAVTKAIEAHLATLPERNREAEYEQTMAGVKAKAAREKQERGEDLSDKEKTDIAKQDLEDALGELVMFATKSGRLNIAPEEEQTLLPILTKVMDAAFRMGYYEFKRAAKFVIDKIREYAGDKFADQIDLKHLQGAYIAMSGKYEDQGASPIMEVASVKSLDELEAEPTVEVEEELDEKPYKFGVNTQVIEEIRDRLIGGEGFKTIVEARNFIEKLRNTKIEPGTSEAKEADELIEAGVVMAAQEIIRSGRAQGRTSQQIYDRLVGLYERQPNLAVRSSTSVANQAYSTPAPLAFVASELAGINNDTTVYEPTAGNGMLLIGANPDLVTANELDRRRFEVLRKMFIESDADINLGNALEHEFKPGSFDVVIENPPFGKVGNISNIDQEIANNSLRAMKEDGRALLILGGVQANTEDGRREGYRGKAKREFYYNLYKDYNVVDHFTVGGNMYAKQGTSYPVDVIVIDGKGQSSRDLPAADLPQLITSYEQLKEKLNERMVSGQAGRPGRADSGEAAAGEGKPSRVGERPVGEGERTGDEGRGPAGVGERGVQENEPATGGQREPTGGRAGEEQPGAADVSERGRDTEPVAGTSEAERGRKAGDEGNKPRELGGVSVVSGERVGSGLKDRAGQEQETANQVSYFPRSKASSVGTLVPKAMADSIEQSLARVEAQFGDLDNYVAESLEMDPETVRELFSAEQVDALALSIKNAEEGKGFIIGDQTGVGKGRVVAAMIRYALVHGKIPIFVTEKPNLYSDMIRDLDDIGMTDELALDTAKPKILMTNSDQKVPYTLLRSKNGEITENNLILQSPASKAALDGILKRMREDDSLGQYKVVFTTYSQMQNVRGKGTERQNFIKHFGAGNYMIFDESHNAGGAGETQARTKEQRKKAEEGESLVTGRAAFVRNLVQNAFGTFFSSATYAKRPDVMDLYSSTDMRLAVDKLSELSDAIKAGGIPMQQTVAQMLTQVGQYIRRERTFAGVSYDTQETKVDKETAENMATSMRDILAFSRAKEIVVKGMQKELDKQGARAGMEGEKSQIQSVNFGSTMHNLIDQMLLSLKAQDSVRHAIERLKAGESVVMTVSNTMGSFLQSYADDMGLVTGDQVDLSFGDLYKRYLEKQRVIKIKMPGNRVQEYRLTDEDLGETLTATYNRIANFIDNAGFGSAPISPIDYLHAELRKAGYKTEEITGRTLTINYESGRPLLTTRSANIKQRVNAVKAFNSGGADVIILNQAGSTGLSLHASSKNKVEGQRKRHMIIVQPEKNIDTHMQMLGRVHRTGQVIPPAYSQMMADIPAEMRPAAVLLKKMASLSANTTASRKSAVSAEGAVDFMNDYGGQVAQEYLRDNQDVYEALGGNKILQIKEDPTEAEEADIRRLTGYIPILPIKQQEEIYKDIVDRYNDLIALEDSMGTNKLESKPKDLDAKTIESKQITEDKGDPSVFAQPAMMERVDVKRTVKPFSKQEVQDMVDENRPKAQFTFSDIEAKANAYSDKQTADMLAKEADPVRIADLQQKVRTQANHVKTVVINYPVGTPISIKNSNGVFLYGVVTNLENKGKTKNPVAGSDWKMTIALANGDSKSTNLTFSQIGSTYQLKAENEINWLNPETLKGEYIPLMDLFDKGAVERREKRWMVTGNILAGYAAVNNMGEILTYTKDDGTTAQGVLMPRTFDFEKAQKNAPVKLNSIAKVLSFFDAFGNGSQVATQDGILKIQKRGDESYRFVTSSSKREGGTYYLDTGLTEITGDFYKSGQTMSTQIYKKETLERALRHLISERGDGIVADSNKEDARKAFQAPLANVEIDPDQKVLNPSIMSEQDRKDMIARLQAARQRRAAIVSKFMKGQAGLSEQAKLTELTEISDSLKEAIKQTKPPRRSAGNFFADATKQWDEGNISDAVYEVIKDIYEQYPFVLQDLKLSVRKAKEGSNAAGQFSPLARLVYLYKGTSGVENPVTIRHELVHGLEQMMSEDALFAVIDEWQNKIKQAIQKDKSPQAKRFFETVLNFFDNPNEFTYQEVLDALPSYEYYQYVNPSEYWAVNAEQLMARKLGSGWDKFVLAAKRLFEGLKNVFGFENNYAVHKAFNEVMSGNGKRMTNASLVDYVTSEKIALENQNTRRNYKGGPAPLASWTSAEESRLDDFIYRIQDKHIDTKRVQEAITNEIGDIADRFDVYMKEELYHGRVAKQTTDFLKNDIQPMLKDMIERGVTLEEFEEYLHNRAAPDRNALIASRNAQMPDGGSGLFDQEVADYMANLDPQKKKDFEALAAEVDKIVRDTQDMLVSTGLEKQETIDIWRKTQPLYVPLNRDKDELDFVSSSTGLGRGYSTRGRFTKTASGSLKTVVDIFGNIALQRERAIVRAEKARVGRALYGLAISSPNPDFWMPINPAAIKNKKKLIQELINLGLRPDDAENIIQEPRVPRLDKATGQVAYEVNPSMRGSENVFAVRINGEDRFIFFNPGDHRALRMVKAMQNLDADQLSGVMGVTAELTRIYAAMNTQYNPVFGAWNFARDTMGAAVNLNGTPLEDRKLEVFKNSFPAVRAIYRDLREKGPTTPEMREWIELFERFQKAGGQTGYREQFSRHKDRATIIQRELENLNASNTRKAAKVVFNWLSDYNDAMENAVRLSAFKAALEEGMSEERAASLAKNLTVNFNRKGESGTWIGALYAFFNAAVQGTARMGKLLVDRMPDGTYKLSKAGKKIIAGGIAIGVIQAVALSMAGFGEDEPPEFLKNKNLIFPTGGGNYLIVPMPLGLNVFPNVGRTLTEFAMSNNKDAGKLMGKLFTIVLDAFNPLGSSGLAQTIAPTLADPLVALSENKDPFGRPISKENRATNPTPGYERNRENATAVSKGLAYALNYMTGGGKYGIGLISPTADQIDFLAGQYAGGVGRELAKGVRFANAVVTGDEIPPYKVPIAGKLYGETGSPAAITDQFYKNVTMLAEHEGTIKRMKEDKQSTTEYKQDNPETSLIKTANNLENRISKLNRTKRELLEKEQTDSVKAQIKRIEEQKTRIMKDFNDRVKKIEGR